MFGCAPLSLAQSPLPSTAKASEVDELRQEVRSLTETVKALQQQVKEQQNVLEKANIAGNQLPQNAETPSASVPALFPTNDSSVVASPPANGKTPLANPTGTPAVPNGGFPTTDESVVTSPAGAISGTATTNAAMIRSPATSPTQPITIAGGGKNYMNISFDGLFALAYSSARDLSNIEVGDHDPQQRGFNARNLEIALDGAVDPYFEGFANIVFKLDNDNNTEIEVDGDSVVASTPVFGGTQMVRTKLTAGAPNIVLVRPKSFAAEEAGGAAAEVESVSVPDVGAAGAAKVTDRHVEEATGPKLDEAAVVVSGGRGLGSAEKYEMVEQLAKLLKGAPGASRAIVDAGWVPYSHQVGQTGKVVKPNVYIALGISGATHGRHEGVEEHHRREQGRRSSDLLDLRPRDRR